MYFPAGFNKKKATVLAGLVVQAYNQHAAFQRNKPWHLHGQFSLVTELRYTERPSRGRHSLLDRELKLLARKRQRGTDLPIGFVACKGGDVYVVFRGTMTAAEWLHDMRARLVRYPYAAAGHVHDGFLAIYDGLRAAMLQALETCGGRGRLYLAGHSLGAALATIAVPDLAASTRWKSPIAYTYGSPRVGDRQFAARYNELTKGRSFRVANTSDLVVSIPFPAPFLGFLGGYFTHVETPIDFTVQEENNEKNHDITTYLAAVAGAKRKGLWRYLWKTD